MTNEEKKTAILTVVAHIPKGQVASYKQVANAAGLINGARLVGKVMSQLPSGSAIPWQRVVNSQRKISFPLNSEKYREQKQLLMCEGVEFSGEKIKSNFFGF